MKKTTIAILLTLSASICLQAQSGNWNFRSGLQLSRLIVHTPKLQLMPAGVGLTADLSLSRRVNPRYYPMNSDILFAGVMLKYLHLGDPTEILGHALGAAAFYDFRHEYGSGLQSFFLVGTGLSYNNRIYDIRNNPQQNAISTSINNLTTFEWRLQKRIKPSLHAYAGISLSHLSNGSYKSPNLGLNYFSFILGLQHGKEDSRAVKQKTPERYKKWMTAVNYGTAYREHKTIGGPKFRIDNLAVECGRSYRPAKLFKAGFEAEYHQLSAYFAERSEIRPDIGSARNISYRLHFYGGHEWTLGPTSLETRLGYQLLRNALLAGIPLYVKLVLQYQHAVPRMPGLNVQAGIALKAHYGNAEYIGVFAGLRFRY